MSLLEKFKEGFVAPEGIDKELEAALDAARLAELRLPKMRAGTVAAESSLRDARSKLNDAALGVVEGTTPQKTYDALVKQVADAESALNLVSQAETAALGKLGEARAAVHSMGRDAQLKRQKRVSAERVKVAARLTTAVAEYVSAFEALLEASNKNAMLWPSVIEIPRYAGLDLESLREMVAREICRHATFDGMRAPEVPGAEWHALSGDPRKYKSLVETISEANDALLASITQSPIVVPSIPAPVVQSDPDAALLNDEPALQEQPPAKDDPVNENPVEVPPVTVRRSYAGRPDPRLENAS